MTVRRKFEGSTAFRRWFKNSKVVDSAGRPQAVYHGTGASFSVFRRGNKSSYYGLGGIYFTGSRRSAEHFAGQFLSGGRVIKAYLSLQNPYYDDGSKEVSVPELESLGYDGIVVEAQFLEDEDETMFVAFYPEQIRVAEDTPARKNAEADWFDTDYPRMMSTLKVHVDALMNPEDARLAVVAGKAAIIEYQRKSLPRDEWLVLSAKALRSNILHGGKIAKILRTHGGLDLQEVQAAIGAYLRHHETDYDSLYDEPGMFKELARSSIQAQLPSTPRPY